MLHLIGVLVELNCLHHFQVPLLRSELRDQQ